jgi:predicted nucleotidyltransferase
MSSTAGTIQVSSGRWGSLCVLAGKRLAVVTPRGHVDYPVRQASGWIAWTRPIDVSKELKRRARAEMERARKRGQRYANDYYARCDDRCNRPRSDLTVASP